MKNTKNVTKTIFGAIALAALAFSSTHSHAAELINANQQFKASQHVKALSTTQFYQLLSSTNSSQIAVHFGMPDQIQTLKSSAGTTAGVIWIYRDAVQKANLMQDAQFMIVDGEMTYVSLTNAS